MLSYSDRERLHHILEAIDRIAEALKGYNLDRFRSDWEKRLVIERLLEIIGEAVNHLSPELQTDHPHVPWPKIVGMRNMVSHEYFRVDPTIIWETATASIPALRSDIAQIIAQGGD
jgi:uncharacterized protein with HEPN domain